MKKLGADEYSKNIDDKAFLYAFDYFFHSNCDDDYNPACKEITKKFHKNPSFVRLKSNCINSLNSTSIKRNVHASEICKHFVESLGEEVSREVFHLNVLVESPRIKNLFAAFDQIVQYTDDSRFPQTSAQATDCSCYFNGTRLVNIVVSKGEELGISLDIDGHSGLAFAAEVLEGGAVHKSGCIKSGDYILQINGNETRLKSVDELEQLLTEKEDGSISFLVESQLTKYGVEFPYYVRSLVDFSINSIYNINCAHNENMINISKGDIFEINGFTEKDWLNARLIGNSTLISDTAFNGKPHGMIPVDPQHEEGDNMISKSYGVKFEKLVVTHSFPGVVRCVLLVGPGNVGRNELKRKLLATFPQKYANVVPHTTRRPRKHEVDGVHYNFTEPAEMQRLIRSGDCIEHGLYNNNWYGTTYDSILQIIRQGKIPVLNVNPKTILKLRNATFKPLVLFVKPPDMLTLKQTRSQPLSVDGSAGSGMALSTHFSDLDFKEMIAASGNLQRVFGAIFDETLVNGVFEEAFAELCQTLANYETLPHFIPQEWVDWI